MIKYFAGLSLLFCASAVSAQETAPLAAVQVAEAPEAFLPANTEVLMAMNQEVTTKGKRWNEGDTFELSVVHDVMLDGLVVIPRGSRGVGRITWMTNKGMFGKSGKMDIELEYLEVSGRRFDVNGTYRQEGEGNTVATVGGVVLAGPFAAFITGKSGRIPQGRELMAHTASDIPVALPANHKSRPANSPIQAMAPKVAETPANQSPSEGAQTRGLEPDGPLTCETCE